MKKNLTAIIRKVAFVVFTISSMNAVADNSNSRQQDHKILIAYFSQPENVSLDGVDAVSGASLLMKNQQILGATQYIAQLIAQKTDSDLYRIEPAQPYPVDHKPLVDLADQEKKDGLRPSLKSSLPDLKQYDTVFIGYPIWWYQMPMILYTFLEDNDLSGKKIIPFSTHGGSRLSGTVQDITRLQPNAQVERDAFSLSRNDVADKSTPDEVYEWLQTLDLK